MSDLEFLQQKVIELQTIVSELEERFKNQKRKFTLDGHILGSIGEIYAHLTEDIDLYTPSHPVVDGCHKDDINKQVQIKITQGKKILLTSCVDNLLVYKLEKDGIITKVYAGEGNSFFKEQPTNVKRHISLNSLKPKPTKP